MYSEKENKYTIIVRKSFSEFQEKICSIFLQVVLPKLSVSAAQENLNYECFLMRNKSLNTDTGISMDMIFCLCIQVSQNILTNGTNMLKFYFTSKLHHGG